jgi:tetratricopeptide (TPR) repeat protein
LADTTQTPSETTPGETPQRPDTPGARLAAKRAAKAARKAAQRGTDNPGEEVTEKLLTANHWLDDHKGKLWGSVLALLVVGGGLITFAMQRDKHAAAIGALLLDAVTTSEGIIATGEAVDEDSLLPTFASAAERDDKALGQFREAAKKDPEAASAQWARLGEANMLLATGKYEEAERAYASVATASKDEAFVQARAIEGAGYALEAQKKPADAIKRFEELATVARGAYKPLGDYHRGRVLAATGSRDEAIKVLQALVKADAAKPADQPARFETEIAAAQTLLEELGVAPEAKASPIVDLGAGMGKGKGGEISDQVMDAIRKQLAAQKAGGAQ